MPAPERKNHSIRLVVEKLLHNPRGRISGRHWLTFSGIALGVFALLTVSSVMNGFDRDMRQRIIGTRSEIRLDKIDGTAIADYQQILSRLQSHKDVYAASPVVRNELVLVKGSALAATVSFGIDLDKHRKVCPVLAPVSEEQLSHSSEQWIQGIVNGHPNSADLDSDGIIIGIELARSLDAELGDTLQLISPIGVIPTPMGMMPRSRPVKVVGIFIAGMPDYDRLYSYISLSGAQWFKSYPNSIDHIDIKTSRPSALMAITRSLEKDFGGYRIENWSSFDTGLYEAMRFEKSLMLIVLGLMFVIASFNMSGNIFRTIIQKRRVIGILKTVGYRDNELLSVFMQQGLLIAVSGIVSGMVLALLVLFIQAQFGIVRLPVGELPMLILPVNIRLLDFLAIPLAALVITFTSIWLPARQAGKVDPLTLIREIN